MHDPTLCLARSGVAKVDLLGAEGASLVTNDEVEAMAEVLTKSGALTPPAEFPKFRSQRMK